VSLFGNEVEAAGYLVVDLNDGGWSRRMTMKVVQRCPTSVWLCPLAAVMRAGYGI